MDTPVNSRAGKICVFRSAEGEARYLAAYQAVLSQWPVPYEEHFIPTRFGDTHVIASGAPDAHPLVLLHSAGSGGVQWILNVEPLSQHNRVYAVDVIGEEGAGILTRPIKQRQGFVDWMADLLDRLHITRANLVGNSFGGFLALNTALYLPERVGKMVLISPAATFTQMWPWYWHLMLPRAVYMYTPKSIADALGLVRLSHRAYAWIWQDFPQNERMARLRAMRNIEGRPRNRLLPPVYSDAELRRVHTPILLLVGDHEVIYNPDDAIRRATRLVPGLRAEMVPNANHNAQMTAPEVVNARILEFLR
jgi:pimeloyl-ACP methyl ester carboxylesterase